jgi:hypothetical protein
MEDGVSEPRRPHVSAGIELNDAQLARLADLLAPRIAAALASQATAPAELIDAAGVARRFGVTAEWVRDHRDELGVIRLGDGPRPRLRFDAETVAEELRRRSQSEHSPVVDLTAPAADQAHPGAGRAADDLDSLPVRQIKPLSTTQKVARRRANAPGPATRDRSSARQQRNSAAADQPSPHRPIRKERT